MGLDACVVADAYSNRHCRARLFVVSGSLVWMHSLHPALASPCSRFTLPPHQTCSLTSSDVLLNLWTRHLNPSVRMHSLHPVSSPDVLVNLIRRAFKFMNMSPKARAPRVQVQYCAQILHIPFYPLPPIQEIISVIRGTHSELCCKHSTAYNLKHTHLTPLPSITLGDHRRHPWHTLWAVQQVQHCL